MRRFVGFIQPHHPNRGAAAQRLFSCLRDRADDIDLIRFVYAGSMEKGTGLRPYRTRDSDVPGQDVDLVLVVGELPISAIASSFARLQALAQPCLEEDDSLRARDFRRERLALKLAPVLEVAGLSQFFIGADRAIEPIQLGDQHEQIRKRTRVSLAQNPRVPFNDLVRVLKWWRHARPPDEAPPPSSLELERLAMLAFDQCGIDEDWLPTLARWCDWLAEAPESIDLALPLRRWLAGGAATARAGQQQLLAEDAPALIDLLEGAMFGSGFRQAQVRSR